MVTVFLADGFEETEAILPVDILRRGGVEVQTCSIVPGKRTVTGSHGIPVTADLTLAELPAFEDAIVLPGGMPGTLNLKACQPLRDRIRRQASRGGILAAICAAPTVLGDCGVLAEAAATCYPGMEGELRCKTVLSDPVVISGSIVTSRGAGTAAEFGFALLAILKDRATSDRIRAGMCFEKAANP